MGKILCAVAALACAFVAAPAAALTLTFAVHVTGWSDGAPPIDDFEMTWTFDPVYSGEGTPFEAYYGDVAGVVDTPSTDNMFELAKLEPPGPGVGLVESYAVLRPGTTVELMQRFRQGNDDTLEAGEYRNWLFGLGVPPPAQSAAGAFVYSLQRAGDLNWLQTATLDTYSYDIPMPPPQRLATRIYTGTAHLVGWDVEPYVDPAVPEPATWTLMIVGFGLTGTALRRRRQPTAATW